MSAARVLQRATTGGVDNSFTETLDKQGMSEQDLDCQGKRYCLLETLLDIPQISNI